MEQPGVRANQVRVTIGRAAVNPELLTVEVERHTTQVQVIHVIFIMDMTQAGLMLGVSNPLFYFIEK